MTGEEAAARTSLWSPVLDALPTAVILLDARGQVARQNPAAAALQATLQSAGVTHWPPLELSAEEGEDTRAAGEVSVVRAWVGGHRLEGRLWAEGRGDARWWMLSRLLSAELPSASPTWVLTPEGEVLYANAAAQRLCGGETGASLLGWVDSEDRAEVSSALQGAHGQGVAFFLRDGHGLYRYLTGRLLDRRSDPVVGGLLLVCQEESRLYATEQRQRELERRFLRLLEGIPEAVLLASVRTEIHYVNHRARDLLERLGIRAGEEMHWLKEGQGLRLAGTQEPYPPSRLPVSRALRGESGVIDDIEVEIDGKPVALELSAAPIRDRGGAILYVIVTIRTITERRRLEQWLQQVSRMDAVGQMAGVLSHDFGNYLTAILSCGHQALELLSPSHPARKDMEDLLSSAHRASHLNRQVLTLGRQQPMAPQRVNLNHLLLQAQNLLERMLGQKSVLRLELEPDLWLVEADVGMMDRVFINLVLNARDAMPSGGSLLISTENAVFGVDRSAGLDPGAHVVVSVRDSGDGMAPDVVARIFEPFFTTKTPGRGTGLGLSMVYSVLRQQGGQVEVISAPGDGTCFRVILPRCTPPALDDAASAALYAEDAASAAGRPAAAEELPLGEGTLLLAEDDAQVRSVSARILRQSGYTVDVFSDAESAWEALCRAPGRYDLLLLDVDLPGMSGIALAQQVLAGDPSARVLLISGREPKSIPSPAQFLSKPFTPQALGAVIWRMLRARP